MFVVRIMVSRAQELTNMAALPMELFSFPKHFLTFLSFLSYPLPTSVIYQVNIQYLPGAHGVQCCEVTKRWDVIGSSRGATARMEPYVGTHNARQDLTYADLCANQWEGARGS